MFLHFIIVTGDSGYGLVPWLMTPILHAEEGSPEDRYTKWHCQNRNVVERTNGYLKGSFRCLGVDQNLHYKPEKACSIIYSCCTLYNIMRHFRSVTTYFTFWNHMEIHNLHHLYLHFRVPMDILEEPQDLENNEDANRNMESTSLQEFAITKRNDLINMYFN